MLRAISLFTGVGGLDFGFEAAGFETSVAVEMDSVCCQTLRLNREWPVIERDIHEVTSRELLRTGKLKRGQADVLIGGPPCQPFSKAGYWARGDSLRLDDPRASTLSAYLRVLEETRPAAFVLENVEGLAYSGKDEGLRLLLDAIRVVNVRTGSSYRPHVEVLNAADHGVPQLRRRVIVVAARDGRPFRFPEPHFTNDTEAHPQRLPYRTCWDALADVEPAMGEDLELRGRWAGL